MHWNISLETNAKMRWDFKISMHLLIHIGVLQTHANLFFFPLSLFNSTMHLSRSSRMWQNSFWDPCLEYKAASIKTPLCEAKKNQMHLSSDVAIICPQCTWEFFTWTLCIWSSKYPTAFNMDTHLQSYCIITLLCQFKIILSYWPSLKAF